MSTYKRQPVAFESGEGSWLIAENGERYLDALSGISVCNIGHANPNISRVISEQASHLLHTSNLYRIPLQEELAEKLCELSGLDRVFFCNSGAEANEAAIKMCRKFASQQGIINPHVVVMEGSFHGRTMATLSATGNDKVHEGFEPLVQGFTHIPYNDINALQELANRDIGIVAVMLEPIQGEGGVVVPDSGYLKSVRELCDENNWLLVLDEVQTGMCRTGQWFAWQHETACPDIMTLAKSLGNGLPIGACLSNTRAAEPMLPGTHGSTFGGNPLASRTALAVIDFMAKNSLPEHVLHLGQQMLSLFRSELGNTAAVVDVRGKGLMIGIELDRECGELVERALRDKLLINVTAGNVVRLLPPLTMTNEEMESIITKVCRLVKAFAGE